MLRLRCMEAEGEEGEDDQISGSRKSKNGTKDDDVTRRGRTRKNWETDDDVLIPKMGSDGHPMIICGIGGGRGGGGRVPTKTTKWDYPLVKCE